MKIKKFTISNFKAYKSVEFDFNNTSIIIGRNDAGKSTVLQALDLFFNPKEVNKEGIFYKEANRVENEITIECYFDIEANEIRLGGEDKEILLTETNLLDKEGHLVVEFRYTQESLKRTPFMQKVMLNVITIIYQHLTGLQRKIPLNK